MSSKVTFDGCGLRCRVARWRERGAFAGAAASHARTVVFAECRPAAPPGSSRWEASPVHISRICIENFRSIKSLELTDLPPALVLVGENGSGKSTLLERCGSF
jgi:hypothetical protein